ncbi:MAG: type III pantothenate kinase [Candidatus Omnitrophota bacterium]|nr:type III pantothenate kinase [Candidatus Omnitrophota bacterium]
MLLTIDIGNTNISLGLFKHNHLVRRYFILTRTKNFILLFKKIFLKNNIDDVIICSVVPEVARQLEQVIRKLLGKQPYVLGKNIKVPIKNLYKNPHQVGQDRLVAGFAAAKIYGTPVIVLDFGTATTLDIVSRKQEYLGGIIIPGIGMSLEALHEKTALLPKVKLVEPQSIIGRTTQESILSGIFFGFGYLADALVTQVSAQLKQKCLVVLTGGFSKHIAEYIHKKNIIEQDLIFIGLQLIYCLNKQKK